MCGYNFGNNLERKNRSLYFIGNLAGAIAVESLFRAIRRQLDKSKTDFSQHDP